MATGPNIHMSLVKAMNTPEKQQLWDKTVQVRIHWCRHPYLVKFITVWPCSIKMVAFIH